MESDTADDVLEELLNIDVELQDVQDQIKLLLDQQEKLQKRQSELKALLESHESSRSSSNDITTVSRENWSGPFPWDSQADDIRFNVFGISKYRANQREIINAIMSGRDVLVIMAAGGGKSLCYQLPAVIRNGVALVVSPLLSLIQDQVMGLTAIGIPAFMLTSLTTKDDEKFIYKALEKGEGELKKFIYKALHINRVYFKNNPKNIFWKFCGRMFCCVFYPVLLIQIWRFLRHLKDNFPNFNFDILQIF